MNIDRHNYEEFFLLYVDNELSAQERNAVEVFVAENADLKAELNLLQQTVFYADDVVFENKQGLLKDEMAALKEQLMLYLDDELNTTDKINTAALLKVDETAQKEFALLERTQLQPDTTIVFADKKSLYRKEEGRVIGIAWWRIAAAAVLLGFGIWGTVKLVSNNKVDKGTEVASGTAPAKQSGVPAVTSNNNKSAEQTNTTASTIKPVENTKKSSGVIPADKSASATSIMSNTEKDNNIAVVKDQPIKKPSNNLPAPDYNNFNNNNRNNTAIASVTQTDKPTDKFNSGNNDAVVPSTKTNNADNGYALTTNFTQSNSEEPNNDKVLYMDENNVKKSKLGGLFRKVKRLVERNTNIKTGDGIKVAGFDIAIK
jgi:hypothetical protein